MNTFVYLFQPQFAALVEAGTKRQTVRRFPTRFPQPGDLLSLRTFLAPPPCSKQRLLLDALVTRIATFSIARNATPLSPHASLDGARLTLHEATNFAHDDGFPDWPAMLAFITKTHGLPFTGITLFW